MFSEAVWGAASRAIFTATLAGYAVPPGSGTSIKLLSNDSSVATERPVRADEIDHHHHAVAEVDEEVDMRDEPDEPCREAGELHLAEHCHRGFAADGGE